MSILRFKLASTATPASVFAEHYEFVLRWALTFTRDDRTAAEDLVQETFVRFVALQTEIEDPQNAEPLLYAYIKNVYLSELRQSQRYPFQNMTTIEFDSLQMSLREREGKDPIELQDEIRNILSYLCWRKESLKPASVLLLRFFHSYSPDEIVKICLMSRQSIDHGLSTARDEVRIHLRSAGKVRIARTEAPPTGPRKQIAIPAEQFMAELEAELHQARSTPCLPKAELLAPYSSSSRKALSCQLLAHVVSCSKCLGRIHAFHGFNDIENDRNLLEDDHSEGTGKKKSKSSRSADVKRLIEIGRRRSREVFEHRPKSLMIVVNGEVVASHDVRSSINTQRIEWKPESQLEFINVMTEQGVCLLAMPILQLPPQSPPEILQEVTLSNGRSVSAVLSFTGPAYVIEVTYQDPLYFASTSLDASSLYRSELYDEPTDTAESAAIAVRLGNSDRVSKVSKLQTLLRSIRMPEFNPSFATALVLGFASLACFVLWMVGRPSPITANDLLVRAESWDASARKSNQPGVVRQKVSITMPKASVERVIYQDVQGVRKPRKQEVPAELDQMANKLNRAGVNWDEPLSVNSYQDWHDHQHVRRDRIARTGSKLLTLTTTTPNGPVSQESITVRESDFHPVMRTVEFRDSGIVQIAELDYDVLPWSKANPDWFEPMSSNSLVPRLDHRGSLRGIPIPLSLDASQIDLAELETRLALARLDVDGTERIDVVRTGTGIQVKGIVGTSARKQEIEKQLHLLSHVTPAIYTFDEMQSLASGQAQVTSVASSSIVETITPLQTYLAGKGWERDDIGLISQELFNQALSIERESKSLEELGNRFGPPENLEDSTRRALEELVAHHRSVLRGAIQREQDLLAKVRISSETEPPQSPSSSIDAKEDFAKKNRALCNELLTGTAEAPRSATLIVSEMIAALSNIQEQAEQADGYSGPKSAASASLLTPHGKQQ